jgi:DNA-binding LacI/PurR family transcriptional regulator
MKSNGKEASLRTLMLLAPKIGHSEPASGTSQLLLHLWELLSPLGWNIRFHIDDYACGKRRQKQWDQLAELEKPQAIVAILGTPAMAAWARDAKIPMFFSGGAMGDFSVPMVGVSSNLMLEEAMDKLIGLGHHHIILPICGRATSFAAGLKSTFSRKLVNDGFDFIAEFNCPTSDESGLESYHRCLDRAFAIKTPTAIICLDWREYVTSLCYLQQKGMKVPQDVSLICQSHDHTADWFIPKPTHFHHPLDKIATTLCGWLEDISTYNNFTLLATVRSVLNEGESVAVPLSK